MGVVAFISLIVVAMILFLAVQRNWISDKALQRLANVATVVALMAAALPFIVSTPSPLGFASGHLTAEFTEVATAPALTPMSTNVINPTLTPAPALLPTPTVEFLEPTPTLSCPAVNGPFSAVWSSVRGEMGCAVGGAIIGLIVEENFEGGKMFWREPIDYAQALVLFSDGTWEMFEHSPYVESSSEFSCPDASTPAQCPPTPKRGFGMMWCDIPEIRNGLGNAIDCERSYQGWMQQFEQGFMLQTDSGLVYVFYGDRRWERW